MIKNFSITKNKFKKEGSSAPDYRMSSKIGEEFVEIGACWLKDSKDGSKFFSCKMADVYVDHEKKLARKGFVITQEGETEIAKTYKPEEGEASPSEIPF